MVQQANHQIRNSGSRLMANEDDAEALLEEMKDEAYASGNSPKQRHHHTGISNKLDSIDINVSDHHSDVNQQNQDVAEFQVLALNKFQRSMVDPSLIVPASSDEDDEQAFGLNQSAQDTNAIVGNVQERLYRMKTRKNRR